MTGAATTTTARPAATPPQDTEHLLHWLICHAYTESCDRYAEGGSFTEQADAAADYFRQLSADEPEMPPFQYFFMGFIQGFALGEHTAAKRTNDTTEPARLAGGLDDRPGTAKRREAAARLAVECIGKCRVYDTDTAAVIYNAVREQRPTYPLEFILGDVYCAGIERGREREQAAQRKRSKALPEARRISTNEPPADRERRAAAAAQDFTRTGYAPISDADTAAIIYRAARAADPKEPFEFLIGRIYSAGKMDGQRMERQRRKNSKAAASRE